MAAVSNSSPTLTGSGEVPLQQFPSVLGLRIVPSQELCCLFLKVCVSVWVCVPLEWLMLGVIRAGWNRGVQEGSCPRSWSSVYCLSTKSDDPLSA